MSAIVGLRNDRVSDVDADRQQRTASEILKRLREQPGVILADEVGMGKTYVALAVAVSVLEATNRKRPVVVMVPSAVADKWPTEWQVFAERCLKPAHGLRASPMIRRGSDFLKLLDDPPELRCHLIFLTHGALTSNLNDPFIRLALLRRAIPRGQRADPTRRAIALAATSLLSDRRFEYELTYELLQSPFKRWRRIWQLHRPSDALVDDPIPVDLDSALKRADFAGLREALAQLPQRRSATYQSRLRSARHELGTALKETWLECLRSLDIRLPLLVLDEAHHAKNPNQLSHLFDNAEAEADAEALQGPLGKMFDRMLFLTATPFQLGHHELLQVLDRFHGVRWPSAAARRHFDDQLDQLRAALDRAQSSALRLERAWGRIDTADGPTVASLDDLNPNETQSEELQAALQIAVDARSDVLQAEILLRPWVIRHVKPNRAQRRLSLSGRSIIDDVPSDKGIPVEGAATLPFLLAARAQALASLQGGDSENATRQYYAYGLASSFEAYADTRRNRLAKRDDIADELQMDGTVTPQLRWYLNKITEALPDDAHDGWASHPKIAATVHRVRQLWSAGEKCLVFCFYVETGRALRTHISRALRDEIVQRGARALNLTARSDNEVFERLDRIGERLLRSDAPGYAAFRDRVGALLSDFDEATQRQVADIAIRFMRTPSFLVRFVDLSPQISVDDLLAGFESTAYGVSLTDRIRSLAENLRRNVEQERRELLAALSGIQTGGIASNPDAFDPAERTGRREILMPNVRLANGSVRQETRRRLMLAFNTPFFPEVLVASSVMSEGVDLQHECRYVIHHDLDWNPSTLEQRTGRVDRIGSKSEAVGEPVVIYEPFIGGTHDEKMYRVVKDRERWFGIVMGDERGVDERTTDELEERVPLPLALAQELTIDLSVH